MERFAHPAERLATVTVLPGPTVTRAPAAGKAPALDPTGKLAAAAAGEIRGQVDPTGATVGGSGFTAIRNTTGSYTISFLDLGTLPTISLSTTATAVIRWSAKTTASFTVGIFDLSGAAIDAAFDFVAYA